MVFPGSKPLSRTEGGVRATASPAHLSTHPSGCSHPWLGPCSVLEVLWSPAPSPTGYAHAQRRPGGWGLVLGVPWDLSYRPNVERCITHAVFTKEHTTNCHADQKHTARPSPPSPLLLGLPGGHSGSCGGHGPACPTQDPDSPAGHQRAGLRVLSPS